MSDASTPAPPEAARRFAAPRPKVPAFARYEGTSAWKKDRRRVRAYAWFHNHAKRSSPHQDAPTA